MGFDPEIHRRRYIRYKGHDYSQPGAYFVTICAWNRECIFGQATGTAVVLTPEGKIVQEEWVKTPAHRSYVRLDQFVIMPNHFHAVLFLEGEEGTARRAFLVTMAFDPKIHRRRSIRYKGHDYSQSGAYFVTICAWNRECILGQATGTAVVLTPEGKIVQEEWVKTPAHRSYVRLDQFVVMPNHFHAVLFLEGEEGTARRAPTETLGAVGAFKSAVARRIGGPVWQRNYFEHIIRNDESLSQIRRYIANNPLNWATDPENPEL